MPCINCIDGLCQQRCSVDQLHPKAEEIKKHEEAKRKVKFPYRFEPMPHQRRALARCVQNFNNGNRGFGFFHAMGAGKTFTVINLMYHLHSKGLITGAVVVCPTPIKNVWSKELIKCAPEAAKFSPHVVVSGAGKATERWMDANTDSLQIMIIGIEALSQGGARGMMEDFVRKHKTTGCIGVIDESSKMKNASAARTKALIKMAPHMDYRVVMTGTPVTQGLHDLWPQMQFLDPDILKCRSYVLFRNLYCIMGGFEGRKIVGYQRQDELMDAIAPFVDMVTKEEALPDLPPKIYEVIDVEVTREQEAAMRQLEQDMMAKQGDLELTVQTVMDRLTRYQQIIGGFFPHEDEYGSYGVAPIAGLNPKLRALMELIELDFESGVKTIIWARFTAERNLIVENIAAAYGADSVRLFDGQVSESDRAQFTEDFQSNENVRFMVANVVVGGMGQTWTAATHEIYYSNDFSYENRMQSEDRAHRKGQKNSVKYTDIVANIKADQMITHALAKKGDVAEYVKDSLKADLGAKSQ